MSAAEEFAAEFGRDLSRLKCANVFNPYRDICGDHDRPDAPALRRGNLRRVLASATERGIDAIWVGLELGYGGGRRTGLPMTDNLRLAEYGRRMGVTGLAEPTLTGPLSEATSSAVWEALAGVRQRVFLWNVFPLHSHKQGEPLSNRRHNALERDLGLPFLARLVERLQPRTLVSIGRDAAVALEREGYQFEAVRHPAYGGRTEFIAGVRQACPQPRRPNLAALLTRGEA